MGEPVRILDMAKSLIRLSGLEPDKDVEIRFTGLRQGEKPDEELMEDPASWCRRSGPRRRTRRRPRTPVLRRSFLRRA